MKFEIIIMLNFHVFRTIIIHKDNLPNILHNNLSFPQITLGDELLNNHHGRRHGDPCSVPVICCQNYLRVDNKLRNQGASKSTSAAIPGEER